MLASQLSIYKDTYQLVKTVTVYVNKMPRLYKFTLGEKILNTAYDLFNHIQMANMFKEDRNKHLQMFIVQFESLKTLLRLGFELRALEGFESAGGDSPSDGVNRATSDSVEELQAQTT